MRNYHKLIKFLAGIALVFFIVQSGCKCKPHKIKNHTNEHLKPFRKPGSTAQDSFHINNRSVVIFYPDSLQLENTRSVMDSSVFDGTMHEYYYQIRNAKNVLRTYWPALQSFELKNYRYLVFHNMDSISITIDLDEKNDLFGMFLYMHEKPPQLIDMTNIETALSNYFTK